MRFSTKVRWLIVFMCGLFLFLDQFFKWQVTHAWHKSVSLLPYIKWEPYLNQGAAFGLPIPNWLILLFTLAIITLLIIIIKIEKNKQIQFLAWLLIFTGATSNFIDRLFHNYVIDYLAIATGIINIADVLIVSGLGLYLLTNLKKTKSQF